MKKLAKLGLIACMWLFAATIVYTYVYDWIFSSVITGSLIIPFVIVLYKENKI
jgi:hypothetical protein